MRNATFYTIIVLGCSFLNSLSTLAAMDNEGLYQKATKYKMNKKLKEYVECCEKAAKDSAWALNELGVINEFGIEDEKEVIVLRNIDKAEKFYTGAAELGLEIAKENLQRVQEAKAELTKLFNKEMAHEEEQEKLTVSLQHTPIKKILEKEEQAETKSTEEKLSNSKQSPYTVSYFTGYEKKAD